VLSTRNLNKSFGSLVVAQDIAISVPRGERYALIGPNGAGKTTLINLMTGMLRPDSGEILLGGDDITALRPDARVKRGLARTFQINTLFAHLTALESVSLSILERDGHAHNWWRSLPRFGGALDEAFAILKSLNLEKAAHRLTRSPSPRDRACCCSTSRRPACRATRVRSCSPRSPTSPASSRCCSSSTT
jgi:branched-chain amino acid transport system ATP-binding protein